MAAASALMVRAATPADLAATADLHIRELSGGLFPRLGHRFMRRWHHTYIQTAAGTALVAVATDPVAGDRVVGFLLGATDLPAYRSEVLTRLRAMLMRSGLLALASRPRTLGYFLRTRLGSYLHRLSRSRRGGARLAGDDRSVWGRTAELTAIAVEPRWRRSGVGVDLVDAFLRCCADAGADTAELLTVAGSTAATRFYTAQGWVPVGVEPARDGAAVQRLTIRVDARSRARG